MNRTPLLAALLALALPASGLAHPSHGSEHAPPEAEAPPPAESAIPETYPEVVTALSGHLADAGKAIEALKIADLHQIIETITGLVEALPAKAGALSEDDRATVASIATRLQEKAAAILSSADSGDMTRAAAAVADIGADLEALGGLVK